MRISDWSSDVFSSDLRQTRRLPAAVFAGAAARDRSNKALGHRGGAQDRRYRRAVAETGARPAVSVEGFARRITPIAAISGFISAVHPCCRGLVACKVRQYRLYVCHLPLAGQSGCLSRLALCARKSVVWGKSVAVL